MTSLERARLGRIAYWVCVALALGMIGLVIGLAVFTKSADASMMRGSHLYGGAIIAAGLWILGAWLRKHLSRGAA